MRDPAAAWPLVVYFLAAVALIATMMGLSHLLGERHRERATGDPFESGMLPTGSARARLPVNYYLVAVLFVVFDVEAAFLFAWALVAREAGWPAFAGAAVFTALLGASLLYLVRVGALDVALGGRLDRG